MKSPSPLVFLLLFLCTSAWSQVLRDYRCKIERFVDAESAQGSNEGSLQSKLIGKEFTVERRTGLMAGALKNAYVTKPEIIDLGSNDNSYKVVNTLKLGQGAGRGSNIYALVVKEFVSGPVKPFVFLDNDEVYFGNCTYF